MTLKSIDPTGRLALFSLPTTAGESTSRSWFLSNVDPSTRFTLIRADPNFHNSGYLDYPNGYAWSPDGKWMLIPDHLNNHDRLWKVSTDNLDWQVVATQPSDNQAEVGFRSNVSWSPDGRWIAWWSVASYGTYELLDIEFVDAVSWKPVRQIARLQIGPIRGVFFNQWIDTGAGDPRFVIWDPRPKKGIYLLHPQDSKQDFLLISYDALASQLDFTGPFLVGPWEPR